MELALGVAVLIVPAVLAVASFGPWLEAREFARAAAAEGARAGVLADVDPAARSIAVVREMATARGIAPTDLVVTVCGTCELTRGDHWPVTVEVAVPMLSTPWGDVGGITVTSSHSEPVDLYRSLP